MADPEWVTAFKAKYPGHYEVYTKYEAAIHNYVKRETSESYEGVRPTIPEWPITTEPLVVYRGEDRGARPKTDTSLLSTMTTRGLFFSTSTAIKTARSFKKGSPCCLFQITVLPGVKHLSIPGTQEDEILIASGGVATVKPNGPPGAIAVEYGPRPKPSGGKTRRRRKTRRRTRRSW